jgi:hypothetical protein
MDSCRIINACREQEVPQGFSTAYYYFLPHLKGINPHLYKKEGWR